MTKRPPPPMYGRVQRKAAPPVHRVLVPSPAVSDVEKQQQMRGVVPAPAPTPAPTPTLAPTPEPSPTPSVQAQNDAPKKKASKKSAAKKRPKWNEDMTREELYRIAKEAGLEVRTRDWKHEIVEALKKAGV